MSGYARANVEAIAWQDTRFDRLARALRLADRDHALIRCARLWAWQTDNYSPDRPTYVVDAETIEITMGIVGAATALVITELAEEVPEGFRIRGAKGRIEWLWDARHAREKGSRPHQETSTDRSADMSPDASADRSPDLSGHSDLHSGSDLLSALPESGSDRSEDLPLSGADARSHETRAARIPARAWGAADFMRSLVLDENPGSTLGKRPWSGTTGARLAWADSIRLLVEKDGRTYEELAEMLDWLFRKQPPGPHRYIVQSPDSLREKWDRIMVNRRNRAAARAAPVNRSQAALDEQLERIRVLEAEEAERAKGGT